MSAIGWIQEDETCELELSELQRRLASTINAACHFMAVDQLDTPLAALANQRVGGVMPMRAGTR